MEEEIKILVGKKLIKEINRISKEYHITRDEWLRAILRNAIRQESVREKILDMVAKEYEEGKLTFEDLVNLIGYSNAKKIESVVEGTKRSFEEAEKLTK